MKGHTKNRSDGQLSRREFLRSTAGLGAGAALASAGVTSALTGALPIDVTAGPRLDFYQPPIDLAIAKGGTPARNCLAAVEALGGFSKFVHPGDTVVVKPNPVGSNPPEDAINTHPEIVEAVVRECFEAGASEVLAVSHDQAASFVDNGTQAAVERGGGEIRAIQDHDEYRRVLVPRGRVLQSVEIAEVVLDADVFINLPIAKHHRGTRVTFAMKNLMGINWDRIYFHRTDLQQSIAELATAVKQHLVIMDANHVLMSNGPAGPGEVKVANQVIAGVDPVAVDAFATRLLDLEPGQVPHIQIAHDLGVGEMALDRLTVREFSA